MKNNLILVFIAVSYCAMAQTAIDKSIPVQKGQTIEMHFDYPELVRVSTWDKNEISIQGTVSINNGENDIAFELETSVANGKVYIKNHIRDMKKLPHRITIVRDGQKITFKTKEDYEKYKGASGGDYNMKSEGVDMDILLEIRVPVNMITRIEAIYGMVEIKDFAGPLTVDATYGGVDATVAEQLTGEVDAQTNYGQIYSNLEVKFLNDNVQEKDFHTFVSAKPGTGPHYSFESKYGNVYLRKPQAH